MLPTLKDGNIVCMQKYNLNLKNNDIVVIRKNGIMMIKRVIGLPNDTIKIDKYIYVNGNKNDDLYIQDSGQADNEITLKENEYFVLGDNRQNSIDSRFEEVGIIHKDEIIGKIVFRKVELQCKD